MQRMGELISPGSKTDSTKNERWIKILKGRYDRAIDKAQKLDSKYGKGIGDIITKLVTLELDGGKCWRCKKEWNKVQIDSIFYSGHYHIPTCECDCICPVCASVLQMEQHTYELKNAGWRCPHCGYELAEFDDKGQMTGKRYGHHIKRNMNLISDNMAKRGDFLEGKFGKSFLKSIQEKHGPFYAWTVYNGLIIDPPIHGKLVNKGEM